MEVRGYPLKSLTSPFQKKSLPSSPLPFIFTNQRYCLETRDRCLLLAFTASQALLPKKSRFPLANLHLHVTYCTKYIAAQETVASPFHSCCICLVQIPGHCRSYSCHLKETVKSETVTLQINCHYALKIYCYL